MGAWNDREGFEPTQAASKATVLPLDDRSIQTVIVLAGIEPAMTGSEPVALPLG